MIVDSNLTQELHNLQEKKNTLEQAVRIASSLEKLNDGLKAVMLMGKPTSSISQKSLENIEELDEKTKILSSQKLKEILERLENTVHEKLALIIEISDKEDGSTEEVEESNVSQLSHDEIDVILKEYLKSAQTAIALKVVLRARGEITKPTVLSLPENDIKNKLNEVDIREKECRVKVKNEMTILIRDTESVLSRDDLPENLRAMVKLTCESLALNLKHIEQGKSIDDMPFAIENVEMASENIDDVHVVSKANKKKIAKIKKSYSEKLNSKVKRGFIYKLLRWVTTPPSVGWNDIDNEIKNKDK